MKNNRSMRASFLSIFLFFSTFLEASSTALLLEYVTYTHPVVTILGSTVALSTIAYRAYEKYQQNKHDVDDSDIDDDEQSETVFLAERYYYEQRKAELTELRDEFVAIYRGITTIKELFHPQIATFSSQFLQSTLQCHTPDTWLRISIADELKLSNERKVVLREAREQELELLEQEITELHAALVVHFDALIAYICEEDEAYYELLPADNHAIEVWNNNRHALTDQIASEAYENDILAECLVTEIKQCIAELKVMIRYYRGNTYLACMQQSTDIIDRLDEFSQTIVGCERWIAEELVRISHNYFLDEQYFAQRGIATAGFKNQVKISFNKDHANKRAKALKKAHEKISSVANNGGPKKDDNEQKKLEDAQAPGMPTEKDGYRPPKGWDGKKVRHPKNGKVGWPDEDGNIWVPTGPGSKAHGGPHWDVQHPNGRTYDNIYPGGKIRPGSK